MRSKYLHWVEGLFYFSFFMRHKTSKGVCCTCIINHNRFRPETKSLISSELDHINCFASTEHLIHWNLHKIPFFVSNINPLYICACRYGDHYEWNKAVTCIHNVLSQQRWLEHYGEVVIRNTQSDECTCKITFVKVNFSAVCPPPVPVHLVKLSFITWSLFHSLVTGAQTAVRMRFRVWSLTEQERWFIGSEASGMKASSVTLCQHQSASGSLVRSFTFSLSEGPSLIQIKMIIILPLVGVWLFYSFKPQNETGC